MVSEVSRYGGNVFHVYLEVIVDVTVRVIPRVWIVDAEKPCNLGHVSHIDFPVRVTVRARDVAQMSYDYSAIREVVVRGICFTRNG